MERPWLFMRVGRNIQRSGMAEGLAAVAVLALCALPGYAARVPVRDGQLVNLKLRNILTTDNVRKNDSIAFDVTEDVVVNGHVVIAKGSRAEARISDVKGAYKPRARDAEVDFRFTTVRAVDGQMLPLRLQPEKPRKGGSRMDEVRERSEVPGQIARVVGADKGKEYEAYIDGAFTVKTSDAVVMTPGEAPEAPAAAPASAPAAAPVAAPAAAPAAPLAATDMATATSSVEFDSTPDGADILIDGNLVGNCHSTLHLTPGHHTIELRLAGYRTWSRTMVVDPESHQSVRATLVPQ